MKLLFSILCLIGSPLSAKATSTIVLAKGEYQLLPVQRQATVANSSGRVVGIVDLGRQLQLLGKSHGSSFLKVGSQLVRVVVVTREQRALSNAVQTYLRGRPGLIWIPDHPCHRLTGELLRFSDWIAVRDFVQLNKGCFQFQAQVAPEIIAPVQEELTSVLIGAGLPRPRLQFLPRPAIFMEPPTRAQLPLIRQTSQSWGLETIFSPDEVNLKPLIRTRIIVAEVSRQRLTSLGLSWPDSYQAQVVPRFQAAQDWSVVLNALEQNGSGRVLASPSLLSRSGDAAEFLAGGEIPLRLTSYRSRQVTYKKYGINLQVTPRSDARGFIDVNLAVEVSHPDVSLSVEGLPAFKVNQIKTHFNVTRSQTIALGGLIRQEDSLAQQGLPGLSQLPVLGLLFASKDFRENRSELIILVTPEVFEPNQPPVDGETSRDDQ